MSIVPCAHFLLSVPPVGLSPAPLENINMLEAKDEDGRTLLHNAAISGKLADLKSLHEKGANLNTTDLDFDTPLHHAAAIGYSEIVTYLCDNDASINLENSDGWTPLLYAFATDHLDIAIDLVQRGGESKPVVFRQILEKAITSDKPEMVIELTEIKPEIFQPLLKAAVTENNIDRVLWLAEIGAIEGWMIGDWKLLESAQTLRYGKIASILENISSIRKKALSVKNWREACQFSDHDFIIETLKEFSEKSNQKYLIQIVSLYQHPAQFFLELFTLLQKMKDSDELLVKVLKRLKNHPLWNKLSSFERIENTTFDSILHGAVRYGFVKVFKALIDFGMDLETKGPQGENVREFLLRNPYGLNEDQVFLFLNSNRKNKRVIQSINGKIKKSHPTTIDLVFDGFVRLERLAYLQDQGCSSLLIVGANLFNWMRIDLTCDPLPRNSPLVSLCLNNQIPKNFFLDLCFPKVDRLDQTKKISEVDNSIFKALEQLKKEEVLNQDLKEKAVKHAEKLFQECNSHQLNWKEVFKGEEVDPRPALIARIGQYFSAVENLKIEFSSYSKTDIRRSYALDAIAFYLDRIDELEKHFNPSLQEFKKCSMHSILVFQLKLWKVGKHFTAIVKHS